MKNFPWYIIIYITIVIFIAIIYLPVIHYSFVWDDVLDLHDRGWLRVGDQWKHYIYRDYHYWTNYFRPLGIGLFTLQVRLFDDLPGPMHALSLCMHLINTLLVGALSWICLKKREIDNQNIGKALIAITMLVYGLHPVLIEPVVWISCQFELLLGMLFLLGLIANLNIRNVLIRAVSVAFLFFLAACTKEAAISFPFLLVIFDWLVCAKPDDQSLLGCMRSTLKRNFPVYAATILAGMAYLAFRYFALGKFIDQGSVSSVPFLAKVQEVSFLYVRYWKLLIWPMVGVSPIHPVQMTQFGFLSVTSVLTDVVALAIPLLGLRLVAGKAPVIGCMVLAVTAALLPVLHVVSVNFDSSLYHERYAMTALTAMCPMFPALLMSVKRFGTLWKAGSVLAGTILLFWITFAFLTIHATLPLWSTNVTLWRWAVAQNPDNAEANYSLIGSYMDAHDTVNAHKLIDDLASNHVDCAACTLNGAFLAIAENNLTVAASSLDKVRRSKQIMVDRKMYRSYLLAMGQILILQENYADAEGVLLAATEVDKLNPEPRISLAVALALSGKFDKAKQIGDVAISLLPSDERSYRKALLYQIIVSSQAKASTNRTHRAAGADIKN